MDRVDFLNEYAIKRCGMPEGWAWFKWEATGPFDKNAPKAAKGHLIVGAVAPKKTRGKYAGAPNWKARDKATECTLSISATDLDGFVAEWERETGACSDCFGSGQSVSGWNRVDGTTYRPCRRCNSSGRAPIRRPLL
jgi:hypothetical protein